MSWSMLKIWAFRLLHEPLSPIWYFTLQTLAFLVSPDSHLCLLTSRSPLDSTQVLCLCTTAWKFSQGCKLVNHRACFICLLSVRDYCPLLPDGQCLENYCLYICLIFLFFWCGFRFDHKFISSILARRSLLLVFWHIMVYWDALLIPKNYTLLSYIYSMYWTVHIYKIIPMLFWHPNRNIKIFELDESSQ